MVNIFIKGKKGLLGDIMLVALLLFTVSTFYFVFSWVVENELISSELHLEQNNVYDMPSIFLKSEVHCSYGSSNYVVMYEYCTEDEISNYIEELFDLFNFKTITYFVYDESEENYNYDCYNIDPEGRLGNCEDLIYSTIQNPNFLYEEGNLDVSLSADDSNYGFKQDLEVDYQFVFGSKSYNFKITFNDD